MLRYKLRTLLILLAILPPVLWFGWMKYKAWKVEQERPREIYEVQFRVQPPAVLPRVEVHWDVRHGFPARKQNADDQ